MRARIALSGSECVRVARLDCLVDGLHVLSLDADDLAQRVHDLDQIGLMFHDLVDVLVRRRNLVDHAAILAMEVQLPESKNPGEFPHRGSERNGRLEEAYAPGPERRARGYLSCELLIAVRGIAVPFLKNALIKNR